MEIDVNLENKGIDSVEPTPVTDKETASSDVITPSSDQVTVEDFKSRARFLRRGMESQNNSKPAIEPEPEPEPNGIIEPKLELEPEQSKIKLPDGEELTLEQILELKRGNMFQADYTRKTQELAEERKRIQAENQKYKELPVDDALNLWNALSEDPVGTIEYLTGHYTEQGITEARDPEVLRVERERAKLAAENEMLKKEGIEKQKEDSRRAFEDYMNNLEVKYKDQGFNKEEVVKYCMEKSIFDPEVAFKAMVHDQLIEKHNKEMEELKRAEQENNKNVVNNYVKDKIVGSATHVPPVGGSSGAGVSISTPKGWKEARKAAIARLNNT